MEDKEIERLPVYLKNVSKLQMDPKITGFLSVIIFSASINGCAKDYISQAGRTDMYADFT